MTMKHLALSLIIAGAVLSAGSVATGAWAADVSASDAEALPGRTWTLQVTPYLWAAGINGELDLLNEARSCEMIAGIFAGRDDILIPKIHWEWCSERVLVQEFVHGISPNDPAALRAMGADKKLLAQKGCDAFLRMALIEGVFHADPVLRKWREHSSGRRDWSTHLWGILMTQAWLDYTRTLASGGTPEAP